MTSFEPTTEQINAILALGRVMGGRPDMDAGLVRIMWSQVIHFMRSQEKHPPVGCWWSALASYCPICLGVYKPEDSRD